jgi:hypothetical protein
MEVGHSAIGKKKCILARLSQQTHLQINNWRHEFIDEISFITKNTRNMFRSNMTTIRRLK